MKKDEILKAIKEEMEQIAEMPFEPTKLPLEMEEIYITIQLPSKEDDK